MTNTDELIQRLIDSDDLLTDIGALSPTDRQAVLDDVMETYEGGDDPYDEWSREFFAVVNGL